MNQKHTFTNCGYPWRQIQTNDQTLAGKKQRIFLSMLEIFVLPRAKCESLLFSSSAPPDTCKRVVEFSLSVHPDHNSAKTSVKKLDQVGFIFSEN